MAELMETVAAYLAGIEKATELVEALRGVIEAEVRQSEYLAVVTVSSSEQLRLAGKTSGLRQALGRVEATIKTLKEAVKE